MKIFPTQSFVYKHLGRKNDESITLLREFRFLAFYVVIIIILVMIIINILQYCGYSKIQDVYFAIFHCHVTQKMKRYVTFFHISMKFEPYYCIFIKTIFCFPLWVIIYNNRTLLLQGFVETRIFTVLARPTLKILQSPQIPYTNSNHVLTSDQLLYVTNSFLVISRYQWSSIHVECVTVVDRT